MMLLINTYYLHVNQNHRKRPLSSFHGVNVAEGRISDRVLSPLALYPTSNKFSMCGQPCIRACTGDVTRL